MTFAANAPMPFHAGETMVQNQLGVRSHVMSYAPKVIRPYMPVQHREFYAAQPFLVVAARDEDGSMWSSLLTNPEGSGEFIQSPTSTSLLIEGLPVPGDALANALKPGSDLGILGIEFATKRRNRVNGRIVARHPDSSKQGSKGGIEFQVDQSFGNCPQYIKPRQWWTATDRKRSLNNKGADERSDPVFANQLSENQMDIIQNSETVFIATGYRGDGEDPRWGNDASHRGGPKGWVDVKDNKTLFLPDYAGNNHYNSIGNLMMDNRMGVTFPLFETGGMIQLSGTAKVDFDERKAAANYPGAKRVIEFTIEKVVHVPDGSLPIRWSSDSMEQKERILQVTRKVKESQDVTSFYLLPAEGQNPDLWSFQPGQHLPISLKVNENSEQTLDRTYSLSGGKDWLGYRISVKREPFGAASTHLHDKVHVGDTITAKRPAGDFVLDVDEKESSRDLVLVSSGVGVTPILSMLTSYVESGHEEANKRRKVVWVHGARDGRHHPFKDEVNELSKLGGNMVETHIVYSQPKAEDTEYDTKGRIDANLLKTLVPDLDNADFYMCGTGSFMADIESGLERLGVDPKTIKFETF